MRALLGHRIVSVLRTVPRVVAFRCTHRVFLAASFAASLPLLAVANVRAQDRKDVHPGKSIPNAELTEIRPAAVSDVASIRTHGSGVGGTNTEADPLELGPAHGWQGILGDVLLDARCAVEVRLIKGAGRIEESEPRPEGASGRASTAPHDAPGDSAGAQQGGETADPRGAASAKTEPPPARFLEVESSLSDLRPQLEALPFSRYEHITTVRQTIPLEETGLFSLKPAPGEEQLLFVAPQTVTGDGVSLMVDWKDVGGEELLSTKLKILNGQGVVLGTDLSPDSSAIVGVRAKCK